MRMTVELPFCSMLAAAVLIGAPILVADQPRPQAAHSVPRLRFVPTEPIRAHTISHLETVLLWEVGHPTLEQRLWRDPVTLIDDVAVSGRRHYLYFNPYSWNGRSGEKSAGIYAYDVRKGRLIRKTRIPEHENGMGESPSVTNYTRTIYHFSTERAYVANVFPEGGHGVWRLNLTRDEPSLLAHVPFYRETEGAADPRLQQPEDLAQDPVVGLNSLLLWGGENVYRHYSIAFCDVRSSTFEGPYRLPALKDARWRVIAGSGRVVYAQAGGREACLLEPRNGSMTVTKRMAKAALVFNSSNVLDASQRRDLAKDVGAVLKLR